MASNLMFLEDILVFVFQLKGKQWLDEYQIQACGNTRRRKGVVLCVEGNLTLVGSGGEENRVDRSKEPCGQFSLEY